MFRKLMPGLALAGLLGAVALGDITLTATPDDTVVAGDTVSISIEGAGDQDLVVLTMGTELGSTSVQLGPFATIELGLVPTVVVPLGTGDVAFSVPLAEVPPPLVGTTLHLQAFSAGFSVGQGGPSVTTCVSNLDALSF